MVFYLLHLTLRFIFRFLFPRASFQSHRQNRPLRSVSQWNPCGAPGGLEEHGTPCGAPGGLEEQHDSLSHSVSLQLYGRRAAWEDPAAWVIDTYPWSATPTPAEWPPLLQLRPEDVGFDGYSAPREGVRKEPPQSDSDADPLVSNTKSHGEEHLLHKYKV